MPPDHIITKIKKMNEDLEARRAARIQELETRIAELELEQTTRAQPALHIVRARHPWVEDPDWHNLCVCTEAEAKVLTSKLRFAATRRARQTERGQTFAANPTMFGNVRWYVVDGDTFDHDAITIYKP